MLVIINVDHLETAAQRIKRIVFLMINVDHLEKQHGRKSIMFIMINVEKEDVGNYQCRLS